MLPLQKRSRLERVGTKLKDAALDGGRRSLPERELLVQLRRTSEKLLLRVKERRTWEVRDWMRGRISWLKNSR